MDSFDYHILDIVQKDNRSSTEDIGAAVGLSSTAVQRRLKRLRDNKAVTADVSLLSPEALGRPMTFIIEVAMERERADLMDQFRRLMINTTEVQQCYYVTGDADFILVLTMSSMTEFDAFTRRVFFGNANIRRFDTRVVIDRVKVGLNVPIESQPTAVC